MFCPKCHASLDNVQLYGMRLHRCSGCKGIWCNDVDLNCLQELREAEMLDIGLPELGREFNHDKPKHCPQCVEQTLHTHAVPGHEHIEGEHCPQCRGWFLDAGELAAVCSHSWVSMAKAFLARINTSTVPN